MKNGRIALAPIISESGAVTPEANRPIQTILDGNPNSPALVRFPTKPPGLSYFLVEAGLSHWPPEKGQKLPRLRKPEKIIYYNGACSDCGVDQYNEYSRIKRARIEIYKRKANNPDKEYRHEKTEYITGFEQTFQDKPGPFEVTLNIPSLNPALLFTDQPHFIIIKTVVLDIYYGQKSGMVAVGEIIYADSAADRGESGVNGAEKIHLWK